MKGVRIMAVQAGLGDKAIRWPYPIKYDTIQRIETDVLVIGAGPAGASAGISAARRGLRVAVCDKAPIKRSGNAGAGIDHWNDITDGPNSTVSADEKYASGKGDNMNRNMFGRTGPTMTHRDYIASRGTWDALMELERLGLPIRDKDGDFDGSDTKDADTGILKSYDYTAMDSIKLRGGNYLKPVLYEGLKKAGAQLYDRVMMTGLLTDEGKQGANVVGAVGFSLETGEFYVFSAKSVIIASGYVCSMWTYSMEITGNSFRWDPNDIGEGLAMAYLAGAKIYGFYNNGTTRASHPFAWPRFGVGDSSNTWTPCTIVDNRGKEVPWTYWDGSVAETVEERVNRPRREQPHMPRDLGQLVKEGMYEQPFWADLSAMPERERRSIWGMMVGNEGKTRYTLYDYYTRWGFNPEKHLLWCPINAERGRGNMHGDAGDGRPWRSERGGQGEICVDWDLMTSIPGLFAAGASSGLEGASYACSSGFYAGNRAAEYCLKNERGSVDEKQVQTERERIYAPVNRAGDPEAYVSWKELWGGSARAMQQCCGEVLTKPVLEFGLNWLESIRNTEAKMTYARNPHELARVMECETRLIVSEVFMRACMAKLEADEAGLTGNEFLFNWLADGRFCSETKASDFYLQEPYLPTFRENYELHRAGEEEGL